MAAPALRVTSRSIIFYVALLVFVRPSSADIEGLDLDLDSEDSEDMALLQKGVPRLQVPARRNATPGPFLIPLRRELSPVIRKGKLVSHRASYSGNIHVGYPEPQLFRVVFDTGSAHVILPSTKCEVLACTKHHRYDIDLSETGEAVNLDGSPVPPDTVPESVTIGFGTAKITGDFVAEEVCLGAGPGAAGDVLPPCVRAHMVTATEMSPRPFEQFNFDGIVGLGLPSLSLNANFSIFNLLVENQKLALPHFGFFLAEGDDGEVSELSVGGHNPKHLLEPLAWVPMAKTELGYWQVQILAVHVNGTKLDICQDGSCHGILDSGTSHLGVPSSESERINDVLTVVAGNATDCRRAQAPAIVLELRGANLTLYPENYMRLLPVPGDILGDVNVTVSPNHSMTELDPNESIENISNSSGNSSDSENLCTPKLLPVSWPEPVGPNIFILGEPVLQRYYTVFDWSDHRAGFGLSAHLRSPKREVAAPDDAQRVQDELVLQQFMVFHRTGFGLTARAGSSKREVAAPGDAQLLQDELVLQQFVVLACVAAAPRAG